MAIAAAAAAAAAARVAVILSDEAAILALLAEWAAVLVGQIVMLLALPGAHRVVSVQDWVGVSATV